MVAPGRADGGVGTAPVSYRDATDEWQATAPREPPDTRPVEGPEADEELATLAKALGGVDISGHRSKGVDDAVSFRLATPQDEPALRAFLAAAALPVDDVSVGSQEYVLAVAGGEVVGSAAVELCAGDALLRSLAHGFDRIPRSEVPPGVAATAQFRSLCPASAAVFRLRLTGAPPR